MCGSAKGVDRIVNGQAPMPVFFVLIRSACLAMDPFAGCDRRRAGSHSEQQSTFGRRPVKLRLDRHAQTHASLLTGISCIFFDEFHERSVESDLSFAPLVAAISDHFAPLSARLGLMSASSRRLQYESNAKFGARRIHIYIYIYLYDLLWVAFGAAGFSPEYNWCQRGYVFK